MNKQDLKKLVQTTPPYMSKAEYMARMQNSRNIYDPWKDDWGKPNVRLNYDFRHLAMELGRMNPRYRGIGPDRVEELISDLYRLGVFNEVAPVDPTYEDLYHQAMALLEEAYEGEEVEGDAAEMLNQWQRRLTSA